MTTTTAAAEPATPTGGATTSRRERRRILLGTGVGNAIEWYDWNVYIVFAPFFAAQFFNSDNPVSALLATLAIFAVGFVMRPLGGFVFGWLADRHGRQPSMLLAIGLAAAGSLMIGLSPTYASVGVVASVVLLLARLLQGLAHGGEIAASHTYITEAAPANRRGRWASVIYVSGMGAVLVATLLGATLTGVLSESQLYAWGWRVPFLLGGLLGIVAVFLRSRLEETAAYTKVQAEGEDTGARPSLLRGMWENRASVVRVVGLTIGGTVFFYTWAIAAPAYAISVKGVDPSAALWAGVAATALLIVLLPFAGALSDRIGRRPNFLIFALGGAAVTFPLNRLIQGEAWQLLLAMSIALVLVAFAVSMMPAALAELFPTHVRASGFAVPYSLAVAITGGTAPYLQTWLSSRGQGDLFLGYTVALLLVTAVTVILTPETNGKPLE